MWGWRVTYLPGWLVGMAGLPVALAKFGWRTGAGWEGLLFLKVLLRYVAPPPSSPLAIANGETKVPGGIWFAHSYCHLTQTARGGLAWPGARW
jgi:hypothetical protein